MKLRVAAAAIATSLVLGAVIVGPSFAGAPNANADLSFGYGPKPGWGWGDSNHEHSGPPGLEGKDKPEPPGHENKGEQSSQRDDRESGPNNAGGNGKSDDHGNARGHDDPPGHSHRE